jgi:tetratricopeptide (TPR) repeat protein
MSGGPSPDVGLRTLPTFYNRPIVVSTPSSSIRRFLPLAILLATLTPTLRAQTASLRDRPPAGRLVLVLPFDNRSGQPNLNWISDSFPYILDQRLNSAGFLTIAKEDRNFALDHLGLPPDLRPTHATILRVAQQLDADYVIVGSFTLSGTGTTGAGTSAQIHVQAQVLEVNQLHLSIPLTASSDFARLFDAENLIAWKVARQIDPHFAIAQETFLAAAGGVKLSSFENYIRGTSALTQEERLKRLQAAVAETPDYPAAQLALGKEQYAALQFDEAAASLAKVPPTDRLALEADFYLGLARFNNAKYADAQSAFTFVASRLPLPEVVNDQGVAASRQGRDAAPLFQRAVTADPNDADYHFNLAVALFRRNDVPAAIPEAQLAVKLRPADAEAAQLLTRLNATRGSTSSIHAVVTANGFDPLERIRRTWSEASFRQAAFQIDQLRALRLATLPPAQQATEYTQLGNDYLAQGLIPEAEQEFQSALTADPRSASAHAGLAQVRERTASPDEARAEAHASLKLAPNVAAYLVLARLDLQANQLPDSAASVAAALRLEPTNSAAIAMKTALQSRGQALP